jgi:hypothetical protein
MGRLFGLLLALSACKVQLSDGVDGGFRASDSGVSDTTMPLGP